MRLAALCLIVFAGTTSNACSPSSSQDDPATGRLLVSAGQTWSGPVTSEIISLGSDSSTCNPDVGGFSQELLDPVGGILKNDIGGKEVPIICGGETRAFNPYADECFILDKSTKQWIQIQARLSTPRKWASSIAIDIGNKKALWIMGGYNGQETLSSTDIVTMDSGNVTIQAGPDLPFKVVGHCQVKLNATTALLIAGFGRRSSTYFLDLPTSGSRFVKGPSLSIGRKWFSCGVVKDPDNQDGQVVIVTGGYTDEDGGLKSTEILRIGSTHQGLQQNWTSGPDLPMDIYDAAGIETADSKSFILVGGYSEGSSLKTVLKMEHVNDNWQWTKLDQKLNVARKSHVVMMLPDSFC